MLADTTAATILALIPLPVVLADTTAATVLALIPPPVVLADTTATAILAPIPDPVVLADTTAATILALRPLPVVLTDILATTILAICSPPVVLADSTAATILAPIPLPVVLAQTPFLGCGFSFALSAHNLDIWIRVISILLVAIVVHYVHAQARTTDLSHSRNGPTIVRAIFKLYEHLGTRSWRREYSCN